MPGSPREWVVRLGDGTEESRRRMVDGLDWCGGSSRSCSRWTISPLSWRSGGSVPTSPPSARIMMQRCGAVLAEAALDPPADRRPILGGRRGHH